MKNLLFIALAFLTLQATAQNKEKKDRKEFKKERVEKIANMNAKDMAQIQTKKMTLHLDLTDAQQQQVSAVVLKNAEARIAKAKARLKAGDKAEKPTEDERLKMMNERLDAQIATKREMKTILNGEQYEKWEKTLARKNKRGKMKRKGKRDGNRNKDR